MEVVFLGHKSTAEGVLVKSFRTHKTVDEVHSFLGLVNFIACLIPI